MGLPEIMKSLEEKSKTKYVKLVTDQPNLSCKECSYLYGLTYHIDDSSKPNLPLHPNCTCYYIEISEEEFLQTQPSSLVEEKPLFLKSWEVVQQCMESIKKLYRFKIPKPPKMTDNKANWLYMTWLWFFEQGENPAYFPSNSPESLDIANSFSMNEVKNLYFKTGQIPSGWTFTGSGTASGNYAEVEWFLGSYAIKEFQLENGIANFKVMNTSGWRSGTRLPKSWTTSIQDTTGYEINELVTDAPRGNVIAEKILKSYPAIKEIWGYQYILQALPSYGGNWDQVFEIKMEWTP